MLNVSQILSFVGHFNELEAKAQAAVAKLENVILEPDTLAAVNTLKAKLRELRSLANPPNPSTPQPDPAAGQALGQLAEAAMTPATPPPGVCTQETVTAPAPMPNTAHNG